jgi:formylglycine-generating enzyme
MRRLLPPGIRRLWEARVAREFRGRIEVDVRDPVRDRETTRELAALDSATDDMQPLGHGAPPFPGMVWVAGGTFTMGSDHHYADEAPAHRVMVDGFWIDQYEVTNRDFAAFVKATGHVTTPERAADPADYPGARPDLLAPASTVFVKPPHPVDLREPYLWWTYVPGADWRHPQGPGSSNKKKPDHPVVHLSWDDAVAFATWAGKDIPTEAEWEYAARGGLDGATYAWGDEFTPGGRWMANTWQGEFPIENTRADGYDGTSPVGQFPANGYGLFDMIGNVWEWTAGDFTGYPGFHPFPYREYSEVFFGPEYKVLRGGSWATRPRVATATFRNWDYPQRRQIFSGMRIARDL